MESIKQLLKDLIIVECSIMNECAKGLLAFQQNLLPFGWTSLEHIINFQIEKLRSDAKLIHIK